MRGLGSTLVVAAIVLFAVGFVIAEVISVDEDQGMLIIVVAAAALVGTLVMLALVKMDPRSGGGRSARAKWIFGTLMVAVLASVPFWGQLPDPARFSIYGFASGLLTTMAVLMAWRLARMPEDDKPVLEKQIT
jgi:hypothetical protein